MMKSLELAVVKTVKMADEYQKQDPTLSRKQAIEKAYNQKIKDACAEDTLHVKRLSN